MRATLGVLAVAAGGYLLVVRGAVTIDLGITPRAMHDKLRVWERSSDMALAAHRTTTGG